MKVPALSPTMSAKVGFELRFNHFVPETPGCYILASIRDEVLYLGQTDCLQRRMAEHWKDPRMTQRTTIGLAFWFYYQEVPEIDLRFTERSLLAQYYFKEGRLPPLNRAGP